MKAITPEKKRSGRRLDAVLLACAVALPARAFAQAAAPPPPCNCQCSCRQQGAPAPGKAAPAPAADDAMADLLQSAGTKDLNDAMFALELQANQTVTSTTKREQHVTQAPSVVTIISREELESRGYTSLADALRTVPGFYDVYDLVTHNVGVRGINGGYRASGSVLKLMIDGEPVSFHPSTGNFFGEELIPLAAVERIEIIRGPASALYGANAYLGVINVITRRGRSVQGGLVSGRVGSDGHAEAGAGAVAGWGNERAELLLAGDAGYANRSGLSLPDTSPVLESDAARLKLSGTSAGDFDRPRTGFAKASLGRPGGHGRLSLLASWQDLDAVGEFQSIAPLSSRTRVVEHNQEYRLAYEYEPIEQLALKVSGGYFDSRPGSMERYDIGQPRALLVRSVRASGFDLAAEARGYVGSSLDLTGGVDFSNEDDLLQAYDMLMLDPTSAGPAGTVMPGEGHGRRKTLQTVGVFLQAIYQITPALSAIGGARLEHHNVYGANFCPRLGLVFAPATKPYYLKLLGGTSFKAPSAEQLYTEPMKPLDILGNADLKPQTARTAELAGGYTFGETGEMTVNLFVTQVVGQVEYVQRGLFLSAENTSDQTYTGGELEGRFHVAEPVNLRLGVGVAAKVADSADASVLIGPRADEPLFPPVQAHLVVDLRTPFVPLRISPELSFVGPRGASQSNVLQHNDAYALPPYFYAAVSATLPEQHWWGQRPTKMSLRATNVFGTQTSEPGFGGVDVPVLGPSVMFTLTQGL